MVPKWVRLDANISQKALLSDLESPGFVPFVAILTHYDAKYDSPVKKQR